MMTNPTQSVWQWNLEGTVANNIKAIPMALVPFQLFQTCYRAMEVPSLCSYPRILKPYPWLWCLFNLLSRDGSAIALLLPAHLKAIPMAFVPFQPAIARWERHRFAPIAPLKPYPWLWFNLILGLSRRIKAIPMALV